MQLGFERPAKKTQALRDASRAFDYELGEVLGEGRVGRVYRATHVPTRIDVALKHLRSVDPENLMRLKREFHILCEIEHPNLAHMYELVVRDNDCFFAMELIEGPHLLEWVRGSARDGVVTQDIVDRTCDAIAQLCSALVAVHSAGIVHRDIKPHNVRVAGTTIKLLDFDLAAVAYKLSQRGGDIAGTLAYMAPEVVWGAGADPDADMYSLGVLAFECLTGRSPFVPRSWTQADVSKQTGLPAFPNDTPEWLETLVCELTSADRGSRPNAGEVLLELGYRTQSRMPPTPVPPAMVGRDDCLHQLNKAFETQLSSPLWVRVTGPSGIGKTHLVKAFCDQVVTERKGCVLRARCLPISTVPFQGIDGIADALSNELCDMDREPRANFVPPNVGDLLDVFPVFSRVDEFAAACGDHSGAADVRDRRLNAFRALRSVVSALAGSKRVVVWIDDVQWTDRDSADFWTDMLQQDAAIVFVTSARQLEDHFAARQTSCRERPVDIVLDPLTLDQTTDLLQRAFPLTLDAATAELLARECQGNPFLALQVGQYSRHKRNETAEGVSLTTVMRERLSRVGPEAVELLELCCLATAPIALDKVASTIDLDVPGRAAEELLRTSRLIERVPLAPTMPIVPYHDGIREAVVSQLPPPRLRAHHRTLAMSFSRQAHLDAVAAFWHWLGAQDVKMTLRFAKLAGEHLMHALAFEQAAKVYDAALPLAPPVDRSALLEKLGAAHEAAGRGRLAAEIYERAASELETFDATNSHARELHRRSAESFMRAGFVSKGYSKIRSLLPEKSMPKTSNGLIVFAIWHALLTSLVKLRKRRARATARRTERLDTLWSATLGTVWWDIALSSYYRSLHSQLAFATDDRVHRIRALATEACYLASAAPTLFRRRIERVRHKSLNLAQDVEDPNLFVLTLAASAVAHFQSGQWRKASEQFAATASLTERDCTGAEWERATAYTFGAWSSAYSGDLESVRKLRTNAESNADSKDDVFASTCVRLGLPNITFLAEDRPNDARRTAELGLKHWPGHNEFSLPDFHALFGEIQTLLYEGRPREARKYFEARERTVRESLLLHNQMSRATFHFLDATTAIASCSHTNEKQRCGRLQRIARRANRRLGRESTAWCKALARAISAAIQWEAGQKDLARSELLAARRDLARTETKLYEYAVVHHLNVLGEQCGSEFSFHAVRPALFAQSLLPFDYANTFTRV